MNGRKMITNCIKNALRSIDDICHLAITYFKFSTSLIIIALSITYFECYNELLKGSIGIEFRFGPYIEKSVSTLILFWACTLFIDIAEKSRRK
jgi:hypothetical protein